MATDDYNNYVKKCIDEGFDKNVSKGDYSYWADYNDDIDIHVTYEGFNIVYVSISGSTSEDYSSYKR